MAEKGPLVEGTLPVDKTSHMRHNHAVTCQVGTVLIAGRNIVDQNIQFIITVGTVIGVFLWLRNDINRLDGEIGSLRGEISSVRGEISSIRGEISSVRDQVTSLRSETTSIRESLAWMRGHMGYIETSAQDKE